MNKDAIIIGGGVIGCSIALRLAAEGLKVTLIERGRVGCEASRAAAGMLCPQTEKLEPGAYFDLCLRSRSMYADFAARIKEISGIDPQYRDEGTLFVAMDEQDLEESRLWTDWQKQAGLSLERLTADELKRLEPSVSDRTTGGVFIPGDHQIENRLLMDALSLAVCRAGATVIEGKEVSSITVSGERATGIVCEGERMEAGAVILAAGSWSGRLLENFLPQVKTIPVRGQMIALRGDCLPMMRVLHSKRCYVIPRSDGRVLIGATVEYTGFQKAVTAAGINSLLDAAIELSPELGSFSIVETWCGLRPDTADHLPIIGESGIDNLLLATGHFRNGILLAPVTAELIAETILGSRVMEEAFRVDRFTRLAQSQSID
ncbi:MAG: glycine oxidase ThiO [Acidobacteriota bacterium]